MRWRAFVFLLVTGWPAAPAAGFAQSTRLPQKADTGRFGDPTGIAREYQTYLYGVIKKISKDEIVLEKTKFGVDTTVKLLLKTKFIRDRKPGDFEQLKVGDQVYVDVKTDKKTGEMSAKKVVSGILPTT